MTKLDDRQKRANRFEREGDVYTVTGDAPQLASDLEDSRAPGGARLPIWASNSPARARERPASRSSGGGTRGGGPSARPSAVLEVWNGRSCAARRLAELVVGTEARGHPARSAKPPGLRPPHSEECLSRSTARLHDALQRLRGGQFKLQSKSSLNWVRCSE